MLKNANLGKNYTDVRKIDVNDVFKCPTKKELSVRSL